jgi:hypothetical protein
MKKSIKKLLFLYFIYIGLQVIMHSLIEQMPTFPSQIAMSHDPTMNNNNVAFSVHSSLNPN